MKSLHHQLPPLDISGRRECAYQARSETLNKALRIGIILYSAFYQFGVVSGKGNVGVLPEYGGKSRVTKPSVICAKQVCDRCSH